MGCPHKSVCECMSVFFYFCNLLKEKRYFNKTEHNHALPSLHDTDVIEVTGSMVKVTIVIL